MSNSYTMKDFESDMDEIFKYVPSKGPKLVACGRCGDVIEARVGNNCSCGYLGDVFKWMIENLTGEHNDGMDS